MYFWDHELEAGAIKFVYENFGLKIAMKNIGLTAEKIINCQEPWWENVQLIADSFTEFTKNLYKSELSKDGKFTDIYQDGISTHEE